MAEFSPLSVGANDQSRDSKNSAIKEANQGRGENNNAENCVIPDANNNVNRNHANKGTDEEINVNDDAISLNESNEDDATPADSFNDDANRGFGIVNAFFRKFSVNSITSVISANSDHDSGISMSSSRATSPPSSYVSSSSDVGME